MKDIYKRRFKDRRSVSKPGGVQSRDKSRSTKTKAWGATAAMTDGFCPQIHLGRIDPSDGRRARINFIFIAV